MAKAVFAGEEIKEFSGENISAVVTAIFTVLSQFHEDFLVRNCPRDAGDGNREREKPY